MRDIIERATIQTMRHFQNLGLEVKSTEDAAPTRLPNLAAQMAELFDKELDGL
jgi:hypothetical protein